MDLRNTTEADFEKYKRMDSIAHGGIKRHYRTIWYLSIFIFMGLTVGYVIHIFQPMQSLGMHLLTLGKSLAPYNFTLSNLNHTKFNTSILTNPKQAAGIGIEALGFGATNNYLILTVMLTFVLGFFYLWLIILSHTTANYSESFKELHRRIADTKLQINRLKAANYTIADIKWYYEFKEEMNTGKATTKALLKE